MAMLVHELWEEPDGLPMFCAAGPMGDGARRLLAPGSQLVWVVLAGSHFEAMTLYYERMGWGRYTTEFKQDHDPYPEEWAATQRG